MVKFNKKLVLLHGYNKNKKDMYVLRDNLADLNYDVKLAELPLLFRSVKYCTDIFAEELKEITADLNSREKISLVGHSTGGIVIRKAIKDPAVKAHIDRCVLIAVPHRGSKLADKAAKISKIFVNIFKPVKSITTENIKEMNLKIPPDIEIGAIAGSKSNLFLGRLLKEENDGRIRVDSVRYEDLKDFKVLPYGHKEIHYKLETAQLIDKFLREGSF
ncbi:MAG: lipase family alpha/beta hydrolase [Halanaerobium sp.]